MNIKGTGSATAAMPPSRLMPPDIPNLSIIGLTASGNAAAKMLRSNVFADTALAA